MMHRNRSRRNSITATARCAAEAVAASAYFVQKKIGAAVHNFIIPARIHICLYALPYRLMWFFGV